MEFPTWLSGRPASLLVEFVLIALIGWQLVVWTLPESGGELDVMTQDKVVEKPIVDVSRLKTFPLFGVADPAGATRALSAPVEAKVVPVAKLNIKLFGTVEAGAQSVAFMQVEPGADINSYIVGEMLLQGVILKKVYADHVEVDVNGVLQSIWLPRLEIDTSQDAASSGSASHSSPAKQIVLEKQWLQRHTSQLMSQVQVTPHFKGGKVDGLLIGNIKQGAGMEKVGVRSGDIIQSINGKKVTNLEQAMAVYQELQSSDNIRVQLVRAGQQQVFEYRLR